MNVAEFLPDAEMSRHAQHLVAFARNRTIPKGMTKQDIVEQFKQAFEGIGGIPRLMMWADQNPSEFYTLYSKLMPATIKAQLELRQTDPDQPKSLTGAELILLIRKEIESENNSAGLEAQCVEARESTG